MVREAVIDKKVNGTFEIAAKDHTSVNTHICTHTHTHTEREREREREREIRNGCHMPVSGASALEIQSRDPSLPRGWAHPCPAA
jgi:porphobilinogen deaminase